MCHSGPTSCTSEWELPASSFSVPLPFDQCYMHFSLYSDTAAVSEGLVGALQQGCVETLNVLL